MQHWTPAELAAHLDQIPDKLCLLDVREPWEYQLVHLTSSQLIPLGQLMQGMHQLPTDLPIAVICHHGVRSMHACYLLARAGFAPINVTGGIDRWAREIDHSMPIY